MSRIYVIGISPGSPLSGEAEEALSGARAIYASERLYGIFSGLEAGAPHLGKCRVVNSVDMTLASLKRSRSDAAVLASGDPMFFGIGRRITEELAGRDVLIYPALSSLQLAFASAALNWDDAYLVSFHGPKRRQWSPVDLPLLLETHGKLAILTGGENTPRSIAAHLPGGARVWVAERLGYSDQRVRKTSSQRLRSLKTNEPNIMIVSNTAQEAAAPVAFGLVEREFRRDSGLITKDEVRAVVLHKLGLPRSGVLWDIGAGSGSVSIEARRLAPGLEVFAIEKDAGRARDVSDNARRLRAGEIHVIRAAAPSALRGLPAPDRVFIGGSGAALPGVISAALKRLNRGGSIVATAITLESVEAAQAAFKKAGLTPEITQVSVSRSRKIGQGSYMKALNPVFILKVTI